MIDITKLTGQQPQKPARIIQLNGQVGVNKIPGPDGLPITSIQCMCVNGDLYVMPLSWEGAAVIRREMDRAIESDPKRPAL